jgi:hypothetical protein
VRRRRADGCHIPAIAIDVSSEPHFDLRRAAKAMASRKYRRKTRSKPREHAAILVSIPSTQGVRMTLGPLEYTVIGFEGNRFDGSIADEIQRVVDQGVVRLVDLVFITKDDQGAVMILELDSKDDPRFASFAPLLSGLAGLFTPEDVAAIADGLPADTSALAVLFEHRWAVRLKDAVASARGFLVSRTTVPPEVLEAINAELEAAAA